MREWTRDIADAIASAGHPVDPDVVEELSQHAAAAYESARAEGLEPDEASVRVERLIGAWAAGAGSLRHRRAVAPSVEPPAAMASAFTGLLYDARYAWRLVWRTPGPAVIAALTMALGIGATTTLFSIAWGVLMRPLPFPEPETLVRMRESREGATRSYPWAMTNSTYLSWGSNAATVEAMAAYAPDTVTLTGLDQPQRIRIAATTASLFAVLRAVPLRGALFTESDEAAANVAVISHGMWQRHFGGAEDVVGRRIHFDGEPYTVAGVLPAAFSFPDRDTTAWIPYRVRPAATPDGGSRVQIFGAIARLKAGVTPAQAAGEATARARSGSDPGLAMVALFGSKGPAIVQAERLLDAVTSDVRDALWVLLAAVGLLLMAATANIASVQLARAATRRRELAIRVSLGAGTGRLARQLVLESLMIGLVGGAGGLAIAFALHGALPALLPADFPRAGDIALDGRVLVFAVLVTLGASVLAGLVPAGQVRRLAPRSGMIEDAGATGVAFSRSATARSRATIMAAQVAVACLLLVGASLLGRTFLAMLEADRGYDAENVLTARIASPEGLFTAERRTSMVTRVLERLRAHPRVTSAGYVNNLPLVPGEAMMAVMLPAGPGRPEPRQAQTGFRLVSDGYVEAMGMRLLEGRTFTDRDTPTSRPVVIVNLSFAQEYLQGRAVGSPLPFPLYEREDWEIVGVVDNVRMRASLDEPPRPEMFVAYPQAPHGIGAPPIVVARTTGEPLALVAELRQIVAGEEPQAALESVMTMEQRVQDSLARPRLYAVVLIGFASFALIIAAVGLFGVLSYAVSQRSRELGVRVALGAQRRQIIGMVVREGLVISAIGVALGLSAAVVATRWLSTFLYGVETRDASTFIVVPAVLLLITVAACAIPARRAASIDPLTVLRST